MNVKAKIESAMTLQLELTGSEVNTFRDIMYKIKESSPTYSSNMFTFEQRNMAEGIWSQLSANQ